MFSVREAIGECKDMMGWCQKPMCVSFGYFERQCKEVFKELFKKVNVSVVAGRREHVIKLQRTDGSKRLSLFTAKLAFEQWEFEPDERPAGFTLLDVGWVKDFAQLLDLIGWLLED
jgi:hypothetical protein